jgi:[ribosomal protein S5]-alanine N-acetyltransferase
MVSGYLYVDNLNSKRLSARFLNVSDIPEWAHFFNDELAVEFLPWPDSSTSPDKAAQWIERQLNRYSNQTYGLQKLILKGTGEFIGQCGLLKQEVDGVQETEVGYHIFKKHWGQGFAPEAAELFISFAFRNDLSRSVISIIDINNIRSQRVAEKNGLKREKQTRWFGMDVYVYRVNSYDWKF